MYQYPLAFILLLTPLVFVHELGHFLFAKLFKVRVDVFSIGFGPKVFSRKRGETEYCISAIPLGGYVKILGQDPSEKVEEGLEHRTFIKREPWKRFLILFGGPLFNFIFATFVFGVILLLGEPHVGTTIGRVVPGSQADKAGLQVKDVITAIDGRSVFKYEDYREMIGSAADKDTVLTVKRSDGQIKDVKLKPQATPGTSIYGESVLMGDIDGLYMDGRYPIVAVTSPNSIAAKAGLSTADVITAVNGTKINSFEEFQIELDRLIQERKEKTFEVTFEKHTIEALLAAGKSGEEFKSGAVSKATLPVLAADKLGIDSSELVVSGLVADSPAEKAGLKVGDLLFALNETRLVSFQSLRDGIQKAGIENKKTTLAFVREGKLDKVDVIPTVHESKDMTGQEKKIFAVGVYPLLVSSAPQMVEERILNPVHLTTEAWKRSFDLTAKTFISIKKLFSRQVSMNTLGGPLLIGKLAGESFNRGYLAFLKVMALISISLAVFNILPVPVLDGGHIVLLGLEVIRGRPLGRKQTELIQQVGLSLIMFLLVIVLFNDITKVAMPAIQGVFK